MFSSCRRFRGLVVEDSLECLGKFEFSESVMRGRCSVRTGCAESLVSPRPLGSSASESPRENRVRGTQLSRCRCPCLYAVVLSSLVLTAQCDSVGAMPSTPANPRNQVVSSEGLQERILDVVLVPTDGAPGEPDREPPTQDQQPSQSDPPYDSLVQGMRQLTVNPQYRSPFSHVVLTTPCVIPCPPCPSLE